MIRRALILVCISTLLICWASDKAYGYENIQDGDPTPLSISDAAAVFANLHTESQGWYNGNGDWESYQDMGYNNISDGNEPLFRSTARRVLAYIQTYHVTGNTTYRDLAQEALDYFVAGQDPADGRFDVRGSFGECVKGISDRTDAYATALASRALVEGYREFTDPTYLAAAEDAANWHLNATMQGIYSDPNSAHRYGPPLEAAADFDNANFVAFAAWHMASVYEVTDSTKYIDGASMSQDYCISPTQS
ncbi:MAG: hypothetical protein J7J76_08415 [Candidatus Latescibacteria bacterium]|nr:hypothetical protein [Candidatus Latescibacterota bacterium]